MLDAKRVLFALLRSRMGGSRTPRFSRGFGGGRSALRGTALGLLGGLAVTAFQQYQQRQSSSSKSTPSVGITESRKSSAAAAFSQEVPSAADNEAAQTLVRAMIMAAKADGEIDSTEQQRILSQLNEIGTHEEEREFLLREMARPVDISALVSRVADPTLAEEVYVASLLTIDIDTPAERDYLRNLAARLNLDKATVARLHQQFDAPSLD